MFVYDGNVRDTKNLRSHSYIQINSCGRQNALDAKFEVIRKQGRYDYHLLLVLDGLVNVEFDGKIYNLKRGDFILYPPSAPQKYIREPQSVDLWIHFNGYQALEILNDAGISLGVSAVELTEDVEKLFYQILSEHSLAQGSKPSGEKGALISLLYELGKSIRGERGVAQDTGIRKVISYIYINYTKGIPNESLARMCCLSLSRFLHLFKEQTGTTPRKYQQGLRIENSKMLILSTDLGIGEISRIVGYEDPLYFSRIFKKTTGRSPQEYRAHFISESKNK